MRSLSRADCTRRSLCGGIFGQGFDSPRLHQSKKLAGSLQEPASFFISTKAARGREPLWGSDRLDRNEVEGSRHWIQEFNIPLASTMRKPGIANKAIPGFIYIEERVEESPCSSDRLHRKEVEGKPERQNQNLNPEQKSGSNSEPHYSPGIRRNALHLCNMKRLLCQRAK